MSISHLLATRLAITNVILAAVDSGTAGNLVFQEVGDGAIVATLSLSSPAGTIDNGTAVLTFDTIASDESVVGGDIAEFKVEDSAGTEVFRGSVGVAGSGADLILSSLSYAATDRLEVTDVIYTPPV